MCRARHPADRHSVPLLRRRQPDLIRPYRQWLYPVPSLVALAGWLYVYYSAGRTAIILSVSWLAAGLVAYLIWARVVRAWPSGPKLVREAYLDQQKRQLAAADPPLQSQ
jgi:hypothetical protein